uniref:non-specific protein-tyrosine kinase n=1 Tax=Scylla olivacea TaxID=85551 RepID=A0A0P4WAR5_SCYOL
MAFAWLWKKLKGDERPERHHDRRPSNAGPKDPTHGDAIHRSGSVSEKHDVLTAQSSCCSNSYAVPSHIPGTRKTSTVSISTLDTPWGTPCENPTEERTVVALNDYKGRTDEDLSFRRGEHLEVLKEESQGWWYARSHVTGLSGYIPVPYVARLKSIEAEPWFFGDIKRGECERCLLAPANDHGSFLIRKAESRKDEYSLSVRDMTKVNHYRIRPKDHGGFFISRKDPFPSLHDLVDYYSQGAHGLCTRLNKPCVRVSTIFT